MCVEFELYRTWRAKGVVDVPFTSITDHRRRAPIDQPSSLLGLKVSDQKQCQMVQSVLKLWARPTDPSCRKEYHVWCHVLSMGGDH